jgi:hypothetical protein
MLIVQLACNSVLVLDDLFHFGFVKGLHSALFGPVAVLVMDFRRWTHNIGSSGIDNLLQIACQIHKTTTSRTKHTTRAAITDHTWIKWAKIDRWMRIRRGTSICHGHIGFIRVVIYENEFTNATHRLDLPNSRAKFRAKFRANLIKPNADTGRYWIVGGQDPILDSRRYNPISGMRCSFCT